MVICASVRERDFKSRRVSHEKSQWLETHARRLHSWRKGRDSFSFWHLMSLSGADGGARSLFPPLVLRVSLPYCVFVNLLCGS